MNATSKENQTPVSEQENKMTPLPAESEPDRNEADQLLMRFLDSTKEKSAKETAQDDPFFAPLPDIPDTEDPAAESSDVNESEASEPTDDLYLSEKMLKEQDESISAAKEEADAPSESDITEPADRAEKSEEESNTDTESESSSSGDNTKEPTAGQKRNIGKRIAILAGCTGGLLLVVFGILCAILFRLSGPITVDLDDTVSLGVLETHPILSPLTVSDPSPADIDTSAVGDHTLRLTFFGFLPRTVPVSVRDLTPPSVTAYRMTVGVGTVPDAEDCVLLCEDKTAVTHTFAQAPVLTAAGEVTAVLLSTDVGGNTTETPVTISVLADSYQQTAEFGCDEAAVSAQFTAAYPTYQTFDLSAVDYAVCGEYRVVANAEDARAIYVLHLSDTVAPKGKKHNFNLLSGTVLTPQDFVTDITDASEVTLTYRTEPDFDSLAPQTVIVDAEDAAGNKTEFSCALQIWNISSELTAECGTTLDQLRETLFTAMIAAGADLPTFDNSFDPASLAPGTYSVRLHGKYSTPTVSLNMVDTVAPVIQSTAITAYVGHTLTPESLITEIIDATEVKLSFKTAPDTSKTGTCTAVIVAEDAGGNKTEVSAAVTVIADTVPPAIYGVKTIYAQLNGTVSYRSGVTAYDTADGSIAVKIDASGVNVAKIGKYTVIYTATDKAGNTATQKATVYVTGANQESVNLYADEVLSVIISPAMTDTQKAYAIYSWCVGHLRYSTATSHLMGKYLEAAYSGFTSHIGNCYTYYAVASALLTRAGIENIEIQRNNPKAPHYWNLVKIGGNWYHLDTCPKWKSHPLQAFLLTDWQVKQYSINEVEGYYSFDPSLYPATP